MSRFTNSLARVRVAAPCQADWDEMRGDERVRFCHLCSLNVYNLSAMTRREAERLVARSEGRLCVRFYRRADGTMLTQSCPVGLRALKRRVSRITSAMFAAVIGFFTGVGITPATKNRIVMPSTTMGEVVETPAPIVAQEEPVFMGTMRSMIDPFGEQCAAGASLGIILFVVGYPLVKLREHKEAKRQDELHIWRDS
jgi:hypothetical protein